MIHRRTFLQVCGGLGLLSWLSPWLGARAASPGRSLALLIGIDHYAPTSGADELANLRGCRTDVDLQRELWQSRYGWEEEDILTLVDGEATPAQVETSFQEHLGQARPGDRVIFHFSGYGMAQSRENAPQELALLLGSKQAFFPLTRLQSLIQALKTDQIMVVLDSGFGGQTSPWVGNLRCRNLLTTPSLPLAYPRRGKGSWLWAAAPQQAVLEWAGSGFAAGLFTYALTRTLWQVPDPQRLLTVFQQSRALLVPWVGDRQTPQGETLSSLSLGGSPSLGGAVGKVSQKLDLQNVSLTLPGVNPLLWTTGVVNSYYQVGSRGTWVQIIEQNGLGAKARALSGLEEVMPGDGVREGVRGISRHLKLTVALGESLTRIERVDATSALGDIETVGTVLNVGEGPGDCILDQGTDGGYMLLNVGGQALLEGGAAKSTAIKAALGELPQQLTTLLALKYLRLIENGGTTGLAARVEVAVLTPGGSRPLTQVLTAPFTSSLPPERENYAPVLNPGDRLQFRLSQTASSPLAVQILGITPQGKMLFLGGPMPALESNRDWVLPGNLSWQISRRLGWGQTFILLSQLPFQRTGQILGPLELPQVQEVAAPLTLVQALLQDLDAQALPIPRPHDLETYYLNLQTWVGLSFIYQVLGNR